MVMNRISQTFGKIAATTLVMVSVFAPFAPVYASGARLGDVNFDGIVDIRDAQIAEEYANGKITISAQQRFVGDVDEDGRVGRGDALVIMNYAVGLLSSLPVKMGDINNDGRVTAEDGLAVEKFVNQEMSLNSTQQVVADVDLDQEITLADADLIMRRAVGSLTSLPSYAPRTTGMSWIQNDWEGKKTGGAQHGYTSIDGLEVSADGDIVLSFAIPSGRTIGDVNNDNVISSADKTLLERALAGEVTLSYADEWTADVDGDKRITRADNDVFEAYLAGVVTALPVQFGDLNKDGDVTTAEAARVLEMSVGTVTGSAYERFVANARVDDVVDQRDAQVIIEYAQGAWDCLPVLMEMRDVPCGNAAEREGSGTMTSAVFDAGRQVQWGMASTTASFGGVVGSVELYVRVGGQADSLGEYLKVEEDVAFARIGQFAQYKIVMKGGEDAVLSRVAFHASHIVTAIRDLAPDCSVRGLYATYYNLPVIHPDVQQGVPSDIATEVDPFDRDWYELDKYFAFSRTDALTSLNHTSGFFPVDEGMEGDPHLFATHWSGTLNASATSSYPFVLGSDDDAWMMIDGVVLLNLSGVHGFATATSSMGLTPGLHTIDVFFAERRESESGIKIGIADNLGVSPCVAEPIFENHAPEITGPDALTVRVGNTTHATLVATDIDGDALTFTTTLPEGATFNESTGVFSWAPTTTGTYTATVTVSDGELEATHTITITVLPASAVNHAPIVMAPERIERYLGNTANFTVDASDPDGDALTAASILPNGASFNAETGAFTWTPTDIGEYTATFTYSDGRLSTTATTTIIVTRRVVVNHAPLIDAPATATVNAGEIVQLKVITSDPDGDNVTLSANGIPTDAVFDAALGIFNWIPTEAGSVTLTWSATDGKATTTANTVVTVLTALQCVENVYARINFTRADSIGTGNLLPRVYVGSATNALPSGAWFPLYQNGNPITDASLDAYEDVQGFAIERQNGNFRVLLRGSHEGNDVIGRPNRENAEGTIEIRRGTVLGRLNDDTGNNALEGSDNVIVANGQLTFDMEVTVADDGFLVDVSNVIDCGGPSVNHLPVITAASPISGQVGRLVEFTVSATDPDNDSIVLDASSLPAGAVFDPLTGKFQWLPTGVGSFTVTFSATDGIGTTTKNVIINVGMQTECRLDDVYARIVISSVVNNGTGTFVPNIYLGSATNILSSGMWFPLYTADGAAINDPDIAAYQNVPGLAIQRINGEVRVFNYGWYEGTLATQYPNNENIRGTIEFFGVQAKAHRSDVDDNRIEEAGSSQTTTPDEVRITSNGTVEFYLRTSVKSDAFYVETTEQASCQENRRPVWTGPTTLSGKVGDVLSATITAADADGDVLSYTLELPTGATYSTSTGAFSFTSTAVGAFIAKLWVNDNQGLAPVLHTLTITVAAKDNPPGGGGGGVTPTTGGGGGGGNSTPPTLQIYDIRVTDITNTTAIVSWKTNFLGSSRVIYDPFCGKYNTALIPNFGYNFSSFEIPATVMTGGAQQHTVVLSGLSQATGYCFRVIATGTGQVISGEGSFATNGGFIPAPPVVVPPAVSIPAPVTPVVTPPAVVTPVPEVPAPQTAAVSKVFPLPWWMWVLFLETVLVGILALRERDDRARTSHILSALLIPVGFIDWLGMTRATFVQDTLTLPWYIVGVVYLLSCAIFGWLLWEERMLMREYSKRTRNIALGVVVLAWIAVMVWAFGWGLDRNVVTGIDLLVALFVAIGTLFGIIHFGRPTKADVTMIIGNEPVHNFYTPSDDISRITV